MEQDFEVAPKVNPLEGLPGERLREEARLLARRVALFLISDEGLQAEVKQEHGFGWTLSVDPAVVAAKTGAEFPVNEVWVRHGDGRLLLFEGWDSPDEEQPVIVRFVGCTWFDHDSAFFNNLARAFGSDGVAFGLGDAD